MKAFLGLLAAGVFMVGIAPAQAATPATRGEKWVIRNLSGLSQTRTFMIPGHIYAISFEAVFQDPVHGPVVRLISGDGEIPCNVTFTPFSKRDYQRGDVERINGTIQLQGTGTDRFYLITAETDSDGDIWSLEWFQTFPFTTRWYHTPLATFGGGVLIVSVTILAALRLKRRGSIQTA